MPRTTTNIFTVCRKAQGAEFGCVLADAGYGNGAEFRRGLSERGLLWAVGILPTLKVYPADVELLAPMRTGRNGRPRKHPTPSEPSRPVEGVIAGMSEQAWTRITWRRGRKGDLTADFVALRVKVADGPLMAMWQHLPGEEAWLVAEKRAAGERKYYLGNHGPRIALKTLARLIKSRWSYEQGHEQITNELGLDHYEGRSWGGLYHHALLRLIAFSFLQYLRLGGEKEKAASAPNGTAAQTHAARGAPLPPTDARYRTAEVPVLQA